MSTRKSSRNNEGKHRRFTRHNPQKPQQKILLVLNVTRLNVRVGYFGTGRRRLLAQRMGTDGNLRVSRKPTTQFNHIHFNWHPWTFMLRLFPTLSRTMPASEPQPHHVLYSVARVHRVFCVYLRERMARPVAHTRFVHGNGIRHRAGDHANWHCRVGGD